MNRLFIPSIAFLAGIVVGDIWFVSGLWIVFTILLIVFVFLRDQIWIFFLSVLCLFLGFFWALHGASSYA
jgi:hypothetical protein